MWVYPMHRQICSLQVEGREGGGAGRGVFQNMNLLRFATKCSPAESPADDDWLAGCEFGGAVFFARGKDQVREP